MPELTSYLEEFLEFLMAEPIYIGGFAVLALIVIGALAKKMIKVAIIGIILSLGYVYYLHDYALQSYQEAQGIASQMKRGVTGAVREIESTGDKVMDAIKR